MGAARHVTERGAFSVQSRHMSDSTFLLRGNGKMGWRRDEPILLSIHF